MNHAGNFWKSWDSKKIKKHFIFTNTRFLLPSRLRDTWLISSLKAKQKRLSSQWRTTFRRTIMKISWSILNKIRMKGKKTSTSKMKSTSLKTYWRKGTKWWRTHRKIEGFGFSKRPRGKSSRRSNSLISKKNFRNRTTHWFRRIGRSTSRQTKKEPNSKTRGNSKSSTFWSKKFMKKPLSESNCPTTLRWKCFSVPCRN